MGQACCQQDRPAGASPSGKALVQTIVPDESSQKAAGSDCPVPSAVAAEGASCGQPQEPPPVWDRRKSLISGDMRPPPPPPAASADCNGSAVTVLRQPNRKRTLRVAEPTGKSGALDVSSTTLRQSAATTRRSNAPATNAADLWRDLPVVAKDAVPPPALSTTLTYRSEHSGLSGAVRCTFGDQASDGGQTPKSTSDARSDRNRWDDTSIMEEL
mmetsp:Transcript_86552/g.249744  ORF Transcript_86552/g.249744 Transcript_86552/m.249744 type:complete len:214 (-) Transcript_86552:62-703(-)